MNLTKIPVELQQLAQWVVWKYIERDGKATKVPFTPAGKPASSVDPQTWSTYRDCCAVIERYEGLGFVFADGGEYIGIDLDGCRDPETKQLEQWAKDVVLKLHAYAEVSPSGSGVKMIAKAETRWHNRNNVKLSFRAVGGKDAGIEVYDCKRFFCLTGKQLKDQSAIRVLTDELDWLADTFAMRHVQAVVAAPSGITTATPVIERASRYLAKLPESVSGQAGHNACFHAACALVMGFGLDAGEAYNLLASEYNPRCQPPWSERELRHKIAQAHKQPGARNYLRDAEPSDWARIRLPSSYKEAKQPENPLEAESTTRKISLFKAAQNYLTQLASGEQILVSTGVPMLDHAVGGGFAFGEMVIIAARPSHGKSAVGLQMTHHISKGGLPVVIISEEMSALALGKRAIQFASETPESSWSSSIEDVTVEMFNHFADRAEITVIESCGSVEKACKEIEDLHAVGKCKVALVDYAQLLDAKGKDRYERISRVSQTLRMLASRLQIVVLVLAQLNREIESRKTFTPMMSDIKETGQLEQDADVIVFGVWPFKIDHQADKKKYQFFIAKNRNRAVVNAAFECEFEPERQRLVETTFVSPYKNDFSKDF